MNFQIETREDLVTLVSTIYTRRDGYSGPSAEDLENFAAFLLESLFSMTANQIKALRNEGKPPRPKKEAAVIV